MIGGPTGFSVKHRMSAKNSIDGALGFSLGGGDYIHIHSTYLWEENRGIKIDNKFLGYYFGAGGALFSWDGNDTPFWSDNREDELGLALRGAAGLNYYFNDPNFEVFLEASLHFFFIPATDFDLDLAIGARYFF